MADIEIRITGELLNDPDLKPLIKTAIQAGGLYVKGKIAEYPPRSSRPQPFKTDKSRRFFFAALKDGRIDVPYRRGQSPGSEKLGQSWTVRMVDNGMTAEVGTNVSYAKLVQKEGEQSHYHKVTGWKTDEQIVKQERSNVVKAVEREIARGIARLNR